MHKLRTFSIILPLLVCLGGAPALACRYNVRETGFVDLGIESYLFVGYVGDSVLEEQVSTFKEVCEEALAESNIQFELVNVDQQKDHKALTLPEFAGADSAPSAVLISPDGQRLAIDITEDGRPFKETLSEALDEITSSPVRTEILEGTAKNYGVVLLIEGPEAKANSDANEAAVEAVKTVESEMEYLPKPIANPPVTVTLDANSLADEKILLWSMGLDVNDVNDALGAIFYGSGRWIGPLFRGSQIEAQNLLSVLYVVGGDCECGLDYRWVQGTMLPVKLSEKVHSLAVESLGFDPENPMIKMEIGSIIGRSLGPYAYQRDPYGYQELVIETDSPEDAAVAELNPAVDTAVEPDPDVETVTDQVAETAAAPDQAVETDDTIEDIVHAEPNKIIADVNDVPRADALHPADAANAARSRTNAQTGEDAQAGTFLSVGVMAGIAVGIFAVVIVIGIAVLVRARGQ